MYITIASYDSYIPSTYVPSTYIPSTYIPSTYIPEPTKKPVKKRKLHQLHVCAYHVFESFYDLTSHTYVHHHNSNQETHTHKET